MKITLSLALAAAMLVSPAFAQTISDVDHPDVPNCVVFPKGGTNPPNCENLTIQAVHKNNGLGDKWTYTDPVTHKTYSGYSW